MPTFEIVAGVVLIIAAVIALIMVFANENATTIPLGIAIILGAAGGYVFKIGVHGFHSDFRTKHEAILRDLTRQGFDVKTDDVYARGGNRLYGTEAELRAGSCVWDFNATKIDGTWRLTLPRPDGNGVTRIAPADVAKLREVCPS